MLDELSALEWTHGILTGNTYSRMTSKLESSNIRKYFLNELMFSCNFGDSRKDICKNTARIIHANCTVGLDNKIKLLKECNVWYL